MTAIETARRRDKALVCACGNTFMSDSNFCRKCGKKRPEDKIIVETFEIDAKTGERIEHETKTEPE
jgi:hypothetical protein